MSETSRGRFAVAVTILTLMATGLAGWAFYRWASLPERSSDAGVVAAAGTTSDGEDLGGKDQGRSSAQSPFNGPANLFRNGAFEQSGEGGTASGWSIRRSNPHSIVRVVDIYNTDSNDGELELAARDGDRVVVTQRVPVTDSALFFAVSARALSTQGNFRISLRFFDDGGKVLGTIGWAVVGEVPRSNAREKWFDERLRANFLGKALRPSLDLRTAMRLFLSGVDLSQIAAAEVEITVENGQHGIFDDVFLGSELPPVDETPGIKSDTPYRYVQPEPDVPHPSPVRSSELEILATVDRDRLKLGEQTRVVTTIQNKSAKALSNVKVSAVEPYGFGLVIRAAGSPYRRGPLEAVISQLEARQSVRLEWDATAQRPDAVNLGKAWDATFSVAGSGYGNFATVRFRVEDPTPGTLYYVLTEDMEPMDSAGYGIRTGNRNAWLDPEEYRVQFIKKPEAMNRIAEKYGAKWSHYVTTPAIVGAEWAARRSKTGAWQRVVEEITASAKKEAVRGHQYSPHIHIDYDYRIPGQVISYDEVTDGLWANHNEHGWAHQTRRLGAFGDLGSRTGSLYEAVRYLEELTRTSGQGQHVAVRTGSFDFGDGDEDERMSIEAFRRVGLWASSDADGNSVSNWAGEYGRALYFTRPDDVNGRATSLRELGIIQFQSTPSRPVMYDAHSSSVLNDKVDEGVNAFSKGSDLKPGVHSVVGFTHAMFMLGEGAWDSTIGGNFESLDRHLRYVKETYVDRGLVTFATSNEMIKAYLDYYTPVLLAVYEGERQVRSGVFEYRLRLLGRTIPIDDQHRHSVTVKYPLYLRDSAIKVEILRDGKVIRSVNDLPTPYNDIDFQVDRRAEYVMRVYTGG